MRKLKLYQFYWKDHIFNDAAFHGNLDNIQWLLANKCPWEILYEC